MIEHKDNKSLSTITHSIKDVNHLYWTWFVSICMIAAEHWKLKSMSSKNDLHFYKVLGQASLKLIKAEIIKENLMSCSTQ